MRRRRATSYCVSLLIIYALSALISRFRSNGRQNSSASPASNSTGTTIARDGYGFTLDGRQSPTSKPSVAPNVTLITLWSPTRDELEVIRYGKAPTYLATLLASVAANAHMGVELLLVIYDRYDIGCERIPFFVYPRPTFGSSTFGNSTLEDQTMDGNIRQICMTGEEFWTLYAEFLCDRWKCEEWDKDALVWDLREQGVGQIDRVGAIITCWLELIRSDRTVDVMVRHILSFAHYEVRFSRDICIRILQYGVGVILMSY